MRKDITAARKQVRLSSLTSGPVRLESLTYVRIFLAGVINLGDDRFGRGSQRFLASSDFFHTTT
jgi:hypothetical protein